MGSIKSGEKIIKTLNIRQGLVEAIDWEIVRIKRQTGMTISRSTLWSILTELFIASAEDLNVEAVEDIHTLKRQIISAMLVKYRQKNAA